MTINIDELTVGQLKEISKMGCAPTAYPKDHYAGLPFQAGDKVLIRTVTMIQIGRLGTATADFFILNEGGWCADTTRFSSCLETGQVNEFERSPSWVVVARGAIVDVYPWKGELPVTK